MRLYEREWNIEYNLVLQLLFYSIKFHPTNGFLQAKATEAAENGTFEDFTVDRPTKNHSIFRFDFRCYQLFRDVTEYEKLRRREESSIQGVVGI